MREADDLCVLFAEEHLRPLYLDIQATTPVDPRVTDAMLPYLTWQYGNPHSRSHAYGWESGAAVEEAREQAYCIKFVRLPCISLQVATLIGAESREIIFTSGATESNNLAIKGVAHFYGADADGRRHVITTQTEHKCVLDSCRFLQHEGYDVRCRCVAWRSFISAQVTYLPVQANGIINLEEFEKAIIPKKTCLVSVMTVNNEIGVRQPVEEIGRICRKHKVCTCFVRRQMSLRRCTSTRTPHRRSAKYRSM